MPAVEPVYSSGYLAELEGVYRNSTFTLTSVRRHATPNPQAGSLPTPVGESPKDLENDSQAPVDSSGGKNSGCTAAEDEITSPTESSINLAEVENCPISAEDDGYTGPVIIFNKTDLARGSSIKELWEDLNRIGPQTPVFPRSWALSLSNHFIPKDMFMPEESSHTLSETPAIHACEQGSSAQAKAAKRITGLMDLNDRVVGLKQIGKTDNIMKYIQRELAAYLAWVEKDAGLDRLVSGHYNSAIRTAEVSIYRSVGHATKAILQNLVRRAESMREFLFMGMAGDSVAFMGRRVPNVYTWLVIGHGVKVFVMDPKDPTRQIKELIEIDFSLPGHALWNAVRVAMIMCRARDEMTGIKMIIPEDEYYYLNKALAAKEDE